MYADYDLGDNKGTQKNVEIGNLVFATKPISTLGSLEMIIENKELTSANAKIDYKIDEEKTDKRLIQILDGLEIKILEKSENVQGTAIYNHTLTEDEITNLKQGEKNTIKCDNLESNTKYTIEITGNVELGNTKEEVPVTKRDYLNMKKK